MCENYRLVFLLPVFTKIFERLIYNAMFLTLLDNNIVSSKQSAFKSGDSCIRELIAITHHLLKVLIMGWK